MPGFGKSLSAAALLTLALVASACGSSSSSTTTSTTSAAGASSTSAPMVGTASVACAGSLDKLYNETLGPDFKKATGNNFGGPPCAGSTDLAQEIVAKAISPGVFLAVGAKAIETLFPDRAKFSIALATDPLVVAYSPKSRYASELDAIASGAKPLTDLFTLMAMPGFKIGRTDPTQDPQGEFFILMMLLAQKRLDLPAGRADKILGITSGSPYGSSSQMFSEDALPTAELEGEVDAGSAYRSQAIQYGLKYIALPADLNFSDPAYDSVYSTVSIKVAGETFTGKQITLDTTLVLTPSGTTVSTADQSADEAFVSYLLGSRGRAVLQTAGYTLVTPVIELAPGVSSVSAALPSSVLTAFQAAGGTMTALHVAGGTTATS